VRVATGREVDFVPFVVAPAPGSARKPVVVVIPTFTYLSYANESLFEGMDPSVTGHFTIGPNEADLAHVGNRTFGLSQYDTHPDGHGVVYSSAARPIVNTRHDYRMWLSDSGRGFSAEMYLLEWLTSVGIEFDVITDFELHTLGADYLGGWRAVLTGAHPEYHSGEMLDTLTRYRDTGGHLVYIGGNGFYWVTGVISESPLVVEIRRGFAGITAWKSRPGETSLLSTGLLGGSWRHRGREPQRLVGLGMAAQGWGGSQPYRRTEASYAPEVAWIFDGVDEDPIGAYGRVMGGAAGDELDRADPTLGTPANAVVLASSRDHGRTYQRDASEVAFILDGQHGGDVDPEVHSDVVYFETPGGGAVFAAGSIAYSGALLENGSQNGISRMTENVVRRFAHLDAAEGNPA
jgi:N,N-dimethylformamidase